MLYSNKDPSHIGSSDNINHQDDSQGLGTHTSPVSSPIVSFAEPKGSNKILGSLEPSNSNVHTNDSHMKKSAQPDAHIHQGVDLHSTQHNTHSRENHQTP